MTLLTVLVGATSLIVLLACILTCVRKKKSKGELDKETPLPPSAKGQSPGTTPAIEEGGNGGLYDEASELPRNNEGPTTAYEDLDGAHFNIKKAVLTSHSSIPTIPSIPGILPGSSQPSIPLGHTWSLNNGLGGSGLSSSKSMPALNHQTTTLSSSLTRPATAGLAEEDDEEPPPAVPPKTAEAELIYGENIPESIGGKQPSPSIVAPPSIEVAPVVSVETVPATTPVAAGGMGNSSSFNDDDDDEGPAPLLPPKTAEAELLYDYLNGIKIDPTEKKTTMPENYIAVQFEDTASLAGKADVVPEGPESNYADVTLP